MAEETQYTANTGLTSISTANSNLDGSGALSTVLTAGANGTLVKSVIIKAITNTSKGMVRLFVDDNTGGNVRLIREIPVPSITKSSVTRTFEVKVDLNMTLQSGFLVKASTQNSDTFNLIAEGLDWSYNSRVRKDTTKFTANTGSVIISTANSNLNGTGTLGLAFTAGSSATYKGASISTITIKSPVNVTSGMIRLYIDDLSNKFLFAEIPVPTITRSSIDMAFERTIDFPNDLDLQAGYKIQASTENGESFHVFVTANDWNYYQ